MRKQLLILLFIVLSSPIVVAEAQENDENTVDLYLIKETVEITTDWTDISWGDSIPIYASNYTIVEGEDAIIGIEVSGLNLWVAKEGFDKTKVVVEIEAVIGKPPATVSLLVEKGDIKSTVIRVSALTETGEYSLIASKYSSGIGDFHHSVDLSEVYAHCLGQARTQKTVEDLRGKVYVFYYPWYGNRNGPSDNVIHWEGYTNEQIIASTDYPLLGPYDSKDPRVIRAHIALAKQAGIDGFILSWWGTHSFENIALGNALDVAEEMDFEISVYYESVRIMTKEQVTREMGYIIENYGDHPAFLHESGEPVVFVYVPNVYDRDTEFWLQVRETVEDQFGPITLIADNEETDLLPAFETFHTYIYTGDQSHQVFSELQNRINAGFIGSAEEIMSLLKNGGDLILYEKPFFVTVNPGFWFYEKGPEDLLAERNDGEKYAADWDAALDLSAHTVLITSWNEWHEGTEIEPSREYGFDYLEYTREYIEEYKGTTVAETTPEISLSVNSVLGSQQDTIQITASNAPMIAVNISVCDATTDLTLTGDFYTYLEEHHESGGWIQIPFIDSGETINITAEYSSEIPPGYGIEVNGYDASGNIYRVDGQRLKPVLTRLTCSVDDGSIVVGDQLSITGSISPVISDAPIEIQLESPTREEHIAKVQTDQAGSFSYDFQFIEPGQWRLKAEFFGDFNYYGNSTETLIQVKEKSLLNNWTFLAILAVMMFVAIILVSKRKG